MKLILTTLVVLFSLSIFAQSDLDEVFDDPGSEFSFKIGSNLAMFVTGTPNISAATIFQDDWWVSAEVGITPFRFRKSPTRIFLEDGNVFGTAFGLSGARLLPWDYFNRSTQLMIGLDFQRLNYTSTNDYVLTLSNYNVFEFNGSANPDWYYYHKGDLGELRYRRRTAGYGLLFGASMEFENNLTFNYMLALGVQTSDFQFDEDNSVDITWATMQPESRIKGNAGFYGRLMLSLYYTLKK
ncbi:MAG: hypothetical protein ACFHU9_06185 [Fluviicola sp.]